ncbi:MAG: amino acid adenylation domain-containing protein [Mogibacterium sp.]|nr:amino acid adenylation domain-containing protein [Mogibacterium sp.]
MVRNVLEMLEHSAARVPDKTALKDENESLTYKEYEEAAKRAGTYLLKNVTKKNFNKPVAVVIDRNVWSVVAFMGVVYSGNFYVPIDNTMPAERVKLIYDTLDPIAVIDGRLKADDVIEGAIPIKDMLNDPADEDMLYNVRMHAIDTDPLYGVFTSGSTGVPKGIVPCHRSIIDWVEAMADAFGFDENMIHGSQAPLDFDAFVKDIYNAMRNGSTVVIIPRKLFSMPKLLFAFLVEHKINMLVWAVSAMRIVADFKAFDAIDELPDIRYVMFSGEVMPIKALNYWIEHIPQAMYVNLYGPTETTCNCTYYIVPKGKQDELKPLPIGKPFRNCRVIILDDKREKVITEPGVKGELCVSGTCLALGYWNNPEKTKEAFFQDPTITAYPSVLYGTGDVAYYAENGDLMFASRRDFQVKHMGHRIELGEIEVALNAIPWIDIAICLYDNARGKIVCFYQSEKEDTKAIVKFLSDKLPKFMWPNIYKRYEKLPANKNGKIDRAALKREIENR